MITGAALWPIMTAISSQMATRAHRYTLASPTSGGGVMVPWTQKPRSRVAWELEFWGPQVIWSKCLSAQGSPAVHGHLVNHLLLFFLAAG